MDNPVTKAKVDTRHRTKANETQKTTQKN